jgi:CelD/BcsL family acetyltransferase involved in cellulose biosynthesis
VLLYYSLKDMFERDRPARFDFGFGYNQYKQVFGTQEERRGGIRVGLTKRGKAIISLQVALDHVFKWSKMALEGTALLRWIKKKIRVRK